MTFSVLANARPAVSIDIPTYGARYRSPAQITVSGTATDVDGTVAQVRVKVDTLPIASVIPIQGGYSTSFALDSNGVSRPYNIDASAVDDRGAVSTSAQTSIMVLGTPTVSMSPYCGPCIEGRVYLNLQSNYAPEDSSAVRYFRDGQLIASLTSGVWLYTDRDALAGQHQYSAEITTRFTEIATSLPVNITVLAHSPPSVTMVTPSSGANFTTASAALELRASATQSDFAITRVEFLLNGATVLGQAQLSQGSYAFIWPTLSAVSAGTHQISARATDERGYVAVSDPVSITVTAATVSGPAAAAISFPVTGSEFPAAQAIVVTAGGPSADPNITRIELWRVGTGAGGTDELLTPATGNALSSALTLPSATTSLGLYTIAVNAAGGRTQSATVTITVRADITDPRYFVWTNMNAALKAGNKAAALAYLTPTAQPNYSELFDDSIPQIAAIAASYLPTFVQTELTETTADYLVARTINGQRLIFALRFVRMDDGTWKLESI